MVFHAGASKRLFDQYVRPNGVLFAVHPETWAATGTEYLEELHASQRGKPIEVVPTASTRTALALEHAGFPHHFIKLHYPRRISRFNRRLRRKNIQNSVAVTQDNAHINFDKFAYLPDALGFTFGNSDNSWVF